MVFDMRKFSSGLVGAVLVAILFACGGGGGFAPNLTVTSKLVTGKFAYVANIGNNTVSQYTIDSTTGALTAMTTPTVASGPGPHSIVTTAGSH